MDFRTTYVNACGLNGPSVERRGFMDQVSLIFWLSVVWLSVVVLIALLFTVFTF